MLTDQKFKDKFAAFILSHKRSDRVDTYKTLRRQGYTGKIYIILDNTDTEIAEYKAIYGDQIVVFNKEKSKQYVDSADNSGDMRAVVYARNSCHRIAKDLDLKWFLVLDDDYTSFRFTNDDKGKYLSKSKSIEDLNEIFKIFTQFYIDTDIKSVAFAQGGDFIGGEGSNVFKNKITRKCMNSFFCGVDRPFRFKGKINEDTTTYVRNAGLGELYFTIADIRLEQKTTQSNPGGLTDIYLHDGTYIKSFFSVLYSPSSVQIREMGVTSRRLHHFVKWKHTTPMIIKESVKKARK